MHPFAQIPAALPADDGLFSVVGPILLAMGASFLLFLIAAAACAWLIVRRVRRSAALKRLRLKARRFTTDRSRAQLALLRLQLHEALQATAREVAASGAAGRRAGELPAAARQLSEAGGALDRRLQLAEREPDPAVRSALAAELGQPVREVGRATAELRRAVSATGMSIVDAEVRGAGRRIGHEAAALHAWSAAYTALGTSSARPSMLAEPTAPREHR